MITFRLGLIKRSLEEAGDDGQAERTSQAVIIGLAVITNEWPTYYNKQWPYVLTKHNKVVSIESETRTSRTLSYLLSSIRKPINKFCFDRNLDYYNGLD